MCDYHDDDYGSKPTKSDARQDFADALRKHDWWYMMADDQRVYERGQSAEGSMRSLIVSMGCPYDYWTLRQWVSNMVPENMYWHNVFSSDSLITLEQHHEISDWFGASRYVPSPSPEPVKPKPIERSKIMSAAARMQAYYEQLQSVLGGYHGWHQNLVNADLHDALVDASYIAGGAIASTLLGEAPKDIDVFFYEQRWADQIIAAIKSKLEAGPSDARIAADTHNALTVEHKGVTFQFIREAINVKRESLADRFDFVHTLGWYSPERSQINIGSDTEAVIQTRTLIPTGNGRGLTERYDRALKFKERGWSIDSDVLASLRASAASTMFTLLREGDTYSGNATQSRVEIHAKSDNAEGHEHFEVMLTGEQVRKLRRLRDHGLTFEARGKCELAIVGVAIGSPITGTRESLFDCATFRQEGTTVWGDLIDQASAKLEARLLGDPNLSVVIGDALESVGRLDAAMQLRKPTPIVHFEDSI